MCIRDRDNGIRLRIDPLPDETNPVGGHGSYFKGWNCEGIIRAGLEIEGHARIPAVDSDPEGISAVCDPGRGIPLIKSIAEDRSGHEGFDPDFAAFPDCKLSLIHI